MVRANIDVNGVTAVRKVELAREIGVPQPNLLASILELSRIGVDIVQLETPLLVTPA